MSNRLSMEHSPEQKPFRAGTYLPKEQLLHLVHEAARLWREARTGLLAAGEALTAQLRREMETRPGAPGRWTAWQSWKPFSCRTSEPLFRASC